METDRYQELKSRAAELIQRENWQEALGILDELTQLAPQNHVMAYNRGLVHWKLKDFGAAVLWLHKTLALRNDYAPGIKSLRFVLEEMLQDYEVKLCAMMYEEDWYGALSLLNDMNQYWPNNPHHQLFAAIALQNTGELEVSHEILVSLAQSQPDDQEVKGILAEVEEALRQQGSMVVTGVPVIDQVQPEPVAALIPMAAEEPLAPIVATIPVTEEEPPGHAVFEIPAAEAEPVEPAAVTQVIEEEPLEQAVEVVPVDDEVPLPEHVMVITPVDEEEYAEPVVLVPRVIEEEPLEPVTLIIPVVEEEKQSAPVVYQVPVAVEEPFEYSPVEASTDEDRLEHAVLFTPVEEEDHATPAVIEEEILEPVTVTPTLVEEAQVAPVALLIPVVEEELLEHTAVDAPADEDEPFEQSLATVQTDEERSLEPATEIVPIDDDVPIPAPVDVITREEEPLELTTTIPPVEEEELELETVISPIEEKALPEPAMVILPLDEEEPVEPEEVAAQVIEEEPVTMVAPVDEAEEYLPTPNDDDSPEPDTLPDSEITAAEVEDDDSQSDDPSEVLPEIPEEAVEEALEAIPFTSDDDLTAETSVSPASLEDAPCHSPEEDVALALACLDEVRTQISDYLRIGKTLLIRQSRAEAMLADDSQFAQAEQALHHAKAAGFPVTAALSDLKFIEGTIAHCVASTTGSYLFPAECKQWAEKAVMAYSASADLDPNVATYFNLGLACELYGDLQSAVEALNRVCASDEEDLREKAQKKLDLLAKKVSR